ncbi:hypothetical protein Tco_0780165 [Tanacetum coccineum]
MGDENSNQPYTLGDYSRPSHEGYRNAIELPEGAKTRFKDLLQKLPHHGLDLWLQVQIFYVHVDHTTQMAIDYAAGGRHRKLRPEGAWETIKDLAQHKEEEWNDPIFSEKGIPDYIDATLEHELERIFKEKEKNFLTELGDGIRIDPDGIARPATGKFDFI